MTDAVSGLLCDLSASEELEEFSLKTVIETPVDERATSCWWHKHADGHYLSPATSTSTLKVYTPSVNPILSVTLCS